MKKENQAILEMLACATLWSIAGIFMKKLPWNGFAVAGLRSLIAGTTMLTALPRKDEQKEVRMMIRVIVRLRFSVVAVKFPLIIKV